jgi:hypothetical protein
MPFRVGCSAVLEPVAANAVQSFEMMTMTTRLEPMPDDYTTIVDAIATALLTSLRPGTAADTLRAAAVEMATKLTKRVGDFETIISDVLLVLWDRLEGMGGEDVAELVSLTLEDVRQTVAALFKGAGRH